MCRLSSYFPGSYVDCRGVALCASPRDTMGIIEARREKWPPPDGDWIPTRFLSPCRIYIYFWWIFSIHFHIFFRRPFCLRWNIAGTQNWSRTTKFLFYEYESAVQIEIGRCEYIFFVYRRHFDFSSKKDALKLFLYSYRTGTIFPVRTIPFESVFSIFFTKKIQFRKKITTQTP